MYFLIGRYYECLSSGCLLETNYQFPSHVPSFFFLPVCLPNTFYFQSKHMCKSKTLPRLKCCVKYSVFINVWMDPTNYHIFSSLPWWIPYTAAHCSMPSLLFYCNFCSSVPRIVAICFKFHRTPHTYPVCCYSEIACTMRLLVKCLYGSIWQ